jgi:hypothetical protein
MAATLESQMHQHDDLSLMGLQELDSHLSLFDPSVFRGESSTPGAMSSSTFGDIDQQSHTIIVDTPRENYSQKPSYETGSRSKFAEQRFTNGIKYVQLAPTSLRPLSFGLHFKPQP